MLRNLRSPLLFAALALVGTSSAQNVAINTTGAAPNASAMLDISSTIDGLLIPRMTRAQRVAIPTPAIGLWVYQTDDVGADRHGFWYYDQFCTCPGAGWVRMGSGLAWMVTGNAATNPAVNYLGTSDAQALAFRTNNVERMRILATGQVGINTTTPAEALSVVGGVRLNNPLGPSITNQAGVIRYDNVTGFHQGNENGTPAGYVRLENAERRVTGDEYEGSTLVCGPGQAIVSNPNGASTSPATTPFPTGAAVGSKTQYLFRASELTAFGLCPGNITEIAFFVLDDDNLSPSPGAAITAEVRINATALAQLPLAPAPLDAATSASPVRGTLVNQVVGSGVLPITLTVPFNWNGATNIIVEICWSRSSVVGNSPRVQMDNGLTPGRWTSYAYYNGAFPGCQIDNSTPPTAVKGNLATARAVIRFTGQALGPQPVLAFGDYLQYNGGLLIGTPAWASSGVYSGPGVIRAENAVYDGNVALSDHVFDKYFDGAPREEDLVAANRHEFVRLDDMEDYLARHRHLPNMPSRQEWEEKGGLSLGDLSTRLWQTVEDQALYITELQKQLTVLERLSYGKGLTDAETHELIELVEGNKGLTLEQKRSLIGELRGKHTTTKHASN